MNQEQLRHQFETTRDLIISTARQALADENLPALKKGCKLSKQRGKFLENANGSLVTFYISHKKIKLDIKLKAVYFSDETSVYLHYKNYASPNTIKRFDGTQPSKNFTFLLSYPTKCHVSFRHDFRNIHGVPDANALAKGFKFIREIYEDHKTLYLLRRVSEFHAENEKMLFAACMGTHDRLGEESMIRFLDGDILAIIKAEMLAMDMRVAGLMQ